MPFLNLGFDEEKKKQESAASCIRFFIHMFIVVITAVHVKYQKSKVNMIQLHKMMIIVRII